jgi:hypothetical protein
LIEVALRCSRPQPWAGRPKESVKILLEHGADPHIRNDDGRIVLEEVLMRPTARSQPVAKLLHDAAYLE